MAYRKHLYWILVLIPFLVHAEIYRWVDENGQAVYSDRPKQGAEKVDLLPVPTYKSNIGSPASVISNGTKKNDEKKPVYTELHIVAPGKQETFTDNTGKVFVHLTIAPALRPNDSVRLHLDEAETNIKILTHLYENVDRGTHTLRASIVDADGNVLIQAEPVEFYVKRTSVLFRKPQTPAP